MGQAFERNGKENLTGPKGSKSYCLKN
uniref:Uncharacterized protein n=1 Tax=Rhizophora mucronata TaxID=61149 RepID=A0A2P2NYM9_RHIMU